MAKRNKALVLENVRVEGYAAEGKALARVDGKVIFIEGAVPGDLADIRVTKSKKDWAEGRVLLLKELSPDRTQPFCIHFGTCVGCKWQMLPYALQLKYKQQEAEQNLRRIGKVEGAEFLPIAGADAQQAYRNKLEFTFSNKRFIPFSDLDQDPLRLQPAPETGALGFHAPRIFDKAIDIETCYLMNDINDRIRNTIRDIAREEGFTYYDIKEHSGWLRNILVRYCTTGECMVNLVLNHDAPEDRIQLLDQLLKRVPGITTLLYTINPKWNDSIYDLEPRVYSGPGYVWETLGKFRFKVSPKSFFQTNTKQAEKLYGIVRAFAALSGTETVYDLYCGTGSIGIFLSEGAGKLVGVELVEEAIRDARENAALNGIQNARFFAGDVIRICDDAFFEREGRPDLIITDPPRAGMHEKLVQKLLEIEAPRIVYVSCNTATQARDILLLSEKYTVEKVQPVDMFPHTHHIECVALLVRKTTALVNNS